VVRRRVTTTTGASAAPSSPLFTRDFTLFFAARTISVFGDHMLVPTTVTVAMLRAGYGLSGVGFALAVQMGATALFLVLGGVLVDRFTPLRMMILSDVGRVGVHAGLAATFAVGTPPMWLVLVLLALSGVGAGAFQPGFASVIPRVAGDVQRANAAIRVTESMMMIAGPAVAGLLLAFTEVWIVLVIDTATFAISAVLLMAMRVTIPRREERSTMRRDFAEGWHEFRSHTWLWGVIVIWMVFSLTVTGPFTTLGQSAVTLQHGEATLGLVMSMLGVGAVVGGLVAARFKPTRLLRAGTFALIGVPLGVVTVAADASPVWIALGFGVLGAGQSFWLVMFHTSVLTKVPPDMLGRVNSIEVAGSQIMGPVGRAVAGPVGAWLGIATVLTFSTIMGVVVIVILLAVPAIRNLTRT
jgi:MFS family permease